MNSVALRRGLPGDVPAMFALDQICFQEPFAFDLRSMRQFATQRASLVILAEAGTEMAGFVIVQRYRNGCAYVVTLDVHPDYRRCGVA